MFALFALYLHYLHCICTVSAPLLCALLQLSHFHFALRWLGWAGLGWGQCPVSPRGQLQPRGDMAGADTGAHAYTLHNTHARQCHGGKKEGMSIVHAANDHF